MAPSAKCSKRIPQKERRNERERKRVNQVNQGFNELRDRVPKPNGSKQKLSKVDTLREAARYIQQLRQTLCEVAYLPSPPPQMMQNQQSMQPQHYYHPQMMSPFYPAPSYIKQDISPNSSSYYSDSSYEDQKYAFMH